MHSYLLIKICINSYTLYITIIHFLFFFSAVSQLKNQHFLSGEKVITTFFQKKREGDY